MRGDSSGVRHVVAWLPPMRVATCALLWAGVLTALIAPGDVPLWTAVPLVLAAALLRVLVLLAPHVSSTVPTGLHGTLLAVEVLLLTVLVHLTGGILNPFVVIYAAYVWLAWVTLSVRWGITVLAVATGGIAWLVIDHLRDAGATHHALSDLPTHLFTLSLSAITVAELVAHYVLRAADALADRQSQLDEARDRAARSEKLASLTTLAAGAAHELSTPLTTIAIAARELERAAGSAPASLQRSVGDDARLIRREVDRCRIILDRMSGRAGNAGPDTVAALEVTEIVTRAASTLIEDHRSRLRIALDPGLPRPVASGVETAQALASLLKNAFEASTEEDEVHLRVTLRGSSIRLEVEDHGAGFSPDALRRAGDPFYTTKEPGRGLGLGLFLARTFAERSGGWLDLQSGSGTVAALELPCAGAPATIAS